MKLFAHRGYSGKYPENTMLAFRKAQETGVYGIELDVQMTKDGQLVIIHDEKIDRTSNGTGWVKDFTYEELKEFDFSAEFVGEYGKNDIPLMSEYLDWMLTNKIVTNIELKNSEIYYEGMEEALIQMIRERHLEDRIIFSSFNNVSIVLCKKLAPEIKGGFLAAFPLENPGAYVKAGEADYFHPDQEWLTKEQVDSCISRGVEVNVWTCNTKKVMQRMETIGVSGIFTNYPERALEYYRNEKE